MQKHLYIQNVWRYKMLYKLENGKLIEPPVLWKGVINYNKNLDLLAKDGWLPLIETGEGDLFEYVQKKDHIEKRFYKTPYDYRALRAAAYPSIGDMIDAICKAYDGEPEELQSLMAQRAMIKNTIKKTEE